jgi:RNA polymerase sigma factor (sigma-70 family)
MQTSSFLEAQLERLRNGDDSARTALIEHSVERFRLLARKMFRRSSGLRRLDQTEDILQKALLRIHQALLKVKPVNVAAFCDLASRHIRFVLLDLVREMKSKPVIVVGLQVETDAEPPEAADMSGEPRNVLEWSEFHQKVSGLPDEQRRLFDLLLYQGMTQPEAAGLLNVPIRTLKRHWQEARLHLRDVLKNEWPSLEEIRDGR